MMNEVRRAVRAFDASLPIEKAVTPPSSWYHQPEFLALEYRQIFRDNWLAVGPAQKVAGLGSYVTGEFAEEPFVVVRDERGQLRAFYNVCRHHAACVASGAGQAKDFTCPYHGWRYRLDGTLIKAPHLGAIKDFNPRDFGLKRLEVAEWHGLIFIHFGVPSQSPAECWPELDRRLSRTSPDGLVFVEHREYELSCNWKVFCDNYLDGGYHVSVLHPALGQQLDLTSYQTEVFDGFSIQSSRAKAGADHRLGGGALYAFVAPNLMINRYGPVMDTNIVIPTGPNSCRVLFDFFFEGELAGDSAFIGRSIAQSEQVQLEDVQICHSVQRGLASSAYDVGRYAPQLEHGMYAFHRWIFNHLDPGR